MYKGEAIGSVIVIIMDIKLAESGDLGTWGICKCNEFVDFGRKTGIYMYKCHKWHVVGIVATPIDHAHYA